MLLTLNNLKIIFLENICLLSKVNNPYYKYFNLTRSNPFTSNLICAALCLDSLVVHSVVKI